MDHYNSVAVTLMECHDRYSPLFSVDTRNGDVFWELRIEGFEKAVALRPPAWRKLLDADADTASAMSGMIMLTAIARGDKTVKDSDTLSATAPDKIADWVVTLNEWRLANYQPPPGIDPRGVHSLDEKGRP